MKLKIIMTTSISPATQKFIKACSNMNIRQLQDAIQEGADINYRDESLDDSPVDDMIYYWGICDNIDDDGNLIQISEEEMIEFMAILLDNGFNMNYVPKYEGDRMGVYWYAAKWGRSLKLLEYLLSRGLDPNFIMEGSMSALDNLEYDVVMEEVGCNDPEFAAYLYESARISIAYGALPKIHLLHEYKEGEEEWYRAAMKLDLEFFKSKSAEELIEQQADTMVVCHAKYGFPKESYYEIEKLQTRIIPVLDVIIEKIGIERLNVHTLNDCVELQYVMILEHLLKMGANPNVNCFTEHYKHIRSSAKYTLVKEGHYYKPEARERMHTLLADVEF